MLWAPAGPGHCADTTYSGTRAVPKEQKATDPFKPGTGHPSDPDGEVDEDVHYSEPTNREHGSGREAFFTSCITPNASASLGDFAFNLVTIPFRLGFCYLFDNFRESHVNLFTGSADLESLPDRPWRFGWGFGFGALYLPEAAGGMPFTLHAEVLRPFSPSRQARIRIGSFGSLAAPTVDYERSVYVDGRDVGVQHDNLLSYSQSGYPLTLESLWSGSHGLYLAVGGGAMLLRENVSYVRTTGYGGEGEELSEKREGIHPVLSLGLGRFDPRGKGRKFHRFEIRYQATLLFPDRRSSVPGDNASAVHSLTWDWGWLW